MGPGWENGPPAGPGRGCFGGEGGIAGLVRLGVRGWVDARAGAEVADVRDGDVELMVDLAAVAAREIAVDQHSLPGVDERRDYLALLLGEI